MAFTNSPLVQYTRISPNRTVNRKNKIDTITIHCVVGQCSVETLGYVFADPDREASSNYGVGYDGKIGMYVEEKDRSWCSSSASNDHRAITIEVASDTYHPYAVNSKAYNALINLVADICKRNNIKELKWKGDKSLIGQVDKQNMTVHRWFDTKSCPGDYLYNRMGDIAAKVNAKLNVVTKPEVKPVAKPEMKPVNKTTIAKGDHVKISDNAVYSNGADVPNWVVNKIWVVEKVVGDIVIINKDADNTPGLAINSGLKSKYLTVVKTETKPTEKEDTFKPYMVQVTATALNVRSGPGTNYAVNTCIRDKGVYTIVKESNGWGKLKSGAGWISLNYTKKI